MNNTKIFTDGSSRGNPGPGGWGAIVIDKDNVYELGGRENMTTNNRMELMACIEALKSVDSGDQIILYSDSQYVIKGMTEWIDGWQRKGWKNSQKKAVVNRDLWEMLLKASFGKKIQWKYVAGHTDNPGNNRCDEIATTFADNISMKLYKGLLSKYFIKI
jgi:ribonuclease HI